MNKSAAKRWGEALEREELARLIAPAPPVEKEVPSVSVFAPRYVDGYVKANRQKPSSISAVEQILRNHIIPAVGDLPLDAVDDEQQQKLKARLDHLKPKTVNNVLAVLSGMMTTAVDWKVIPAKPFRLRLLRVPPPLIQFYDFGQLAALIEASAKLDPRLHAMVLLGAHAGARRGEIISQRSHTINFHSNQIIFDMSDWRGIEDCPKGGRYRVVPMTKALAEALRACRHLRGERVLYDDDSKPLTPKVVRDWMKSAQRRAGLKETGGVHILRHTFCSHLAMRGAPARTIKELAGHKSMATTMRYMHLSPGATDAAIRLLDGESGDILETEGGVTKKPGVPRGI